MVFHEAVIIIKFLALFKDIGFGLNVFFAGVAIQIIIGIILLFLRKEADKFNFGKEN
jgi:hypothetical protein